MVEGDIGTGDWLNWHKYSSNAYAALLRDMKNLAALSDKYRLEFSSDIFSDACCSSMSGTTPRPRVSIKPCTNELSNSGCAWTLKTLSA